MIMAKEELTPKKRGRKSKAEVQQDLEQILSEESTDKVSSKVEALARMQDLELIDSVKDLSSEEMIRKFADLNIEISKILSALSDKIVQEIQQLGKVRQVVDLEKKEIERLHKIDVMQTSLDQLIEEYQLKKEECEQEIENLHAQFDEEKNQREAMEEEEQEILAKTRKREAEDFEYKRNLERKKAQDKYEEEVRLRDKQNKEKHEALEKSWPDREQAIKSQEEELVSLRKTVQEYPATMQREIDRAVAAAIQRTEQKLAHEIELLKRDNEAEQRIAELKIKTLEETLLRQLTQTSAMQSQVEEAKKQVQDIAIKAIEGASGAKAFQLAIEQQTKGRAVAV
jgi:hypothetical protein